MPRWTYGGELTPPDTMLSGFTPTRTSPKRWTHELQNAQSDQFWSTPNSIHKWKEIGVPKVYNMEEVRNPQPQIAPCLQSAWISYTNRGIRKDSDLYTSH